LAGTGAPEMEAPPEQVAPPLAEPSPAPLPLADGPLAGEPSAEELLPAPQGGASSRLASPNETVARRPEAGSPLSRAGRLAPLELPLPALAALAAFAALAAALLVRLCCRRCRCCRRRGGAWPSDGEEYAVQIPEGPVLEMTDLDAACELADTCGAATPGRRPTVRVGDDGMHGMHRAPVKFKSIYEEISDPNNLSDCSAESADFESAFDAGAGGAVLSASGGRSSRRLPRSARGGAWAKRQAKGGEKFEKSSLLNDMDVLVL